MFQAERFLQREVILRLRLLEQRGLLAAVWVGSPNGIFIPARTAPEKALARRVVHQLKQDGMLTTGAPDLTFLWEDGCGGIELKRAAATRLFDKQQKGRPSDDQLLFRQRCFEQQVRYAICDSWASVRDTLIAWGRIRSDWLDADERIGRRMA
jgi:hypothetical protein